MKGKKCSESSIITSYLMVPEDANPAGNVHGGVIMKHIDTTAGVSAFRHSRSNAVTASIDSLIFHHPVYIGDLLTLKASVNMVGRTSMEIGVRAEAENLISGNVRHTASAYLTYVALYDDGNPKEVPPLIMETDEEKRRNKDALRRREVRLKERKKSEK